MPFASQAFLGHDFSSVDERSAVTANVFVDERRCSQRQPCPDNKATRSASAGNGAADTLFNRVVVWLLSVTPTSTPLLLVVRR